MWGRRRRRGTPFLHDVEQFCYVIRAFAVLLQQLVDLFPTLRGLGLEFSRKHSTIQIEQPVKPVLFRHCLPACRRGMSAIKSPAPSTIRPAVFNPKPTQRHIAQNHRHATGTRATRVRGMVGRASAIGLPSAPASRSKFAEMALAHAVGDKVEAAYRRGDLFRKRRQLAEAWARCTTPAER